MNGHWFDNDKGQHLEVNDTAFFWGNDQPLYPVNYYFKNDTCIVLKRSGYLSNDTVTIKKLDRDSLVFIRIAVNDRPQTFRFSRQ